MRQTPKRIPITSLSMLSFFIVDHSLIHCPQPLRYRFCCSFFVLGGCLLRSFLLLLRHCGNLTSTQGCRSRPPLARWERTVQPRRLTHVNCMHLSSFHLKGPELAILVRGNQHRPVPGATDSLHASPFWCSHSQAFGDVSTECAHIFGMRDPQQFRNLANLPLMPEGIDKKESHYTQELSEKSYLKAMAGRNKSIKKVAF